ncbi:hypothetical protein Q9L58_008658 [Maublancomyces gigas]|uniref:Tyrosinase copper-binding domain-containing protein n=1 Tax=Discina gigas TaxID=1032678 RepID=A0ABR3G937_9PEZI
MRSLTSLLVSALLFASAVTPTPACKDPIVRKEWRTLSFGQKQSYIAAVKCLQRRPSIATATIPNAINRFDDFQGVHIQRTFQIHFVGHFLAWHRYYVAVYEQALRNECGYNGAQPYWDWTLDSSNLLASPLWDPISGFGGNGATIPPDTSPFAVPGATGGGCICDGPFKDFRLHLGPGASLNATDRCLRRGFSPVIARNFSSAARVGVAMAQADFGYFNKAVEGETNFVNVGIHGGGHYSIGGEAGDLYASPGEPIFFLHHANLDRVYWQWQSKNLPARLHDVSGSVELMGPITGPNVTLAFPIELGPLAPQVTIRDLMDIKGLRSRTGVLCYDYAKSVGE